MIDVDWVAPSSEPAKIKTADARYVIAGENYPSAYACVRCFLLSASGRGLKIGHDVGPRGLAMTTEGFPRLFHEYYAIHETIHAILSEDSAAELDVDEVARSVKRKHPDLSMGPATLVAAIKQAVADTRAASATQAAPAL